MADKNMEAQISVEFEEATSRQSLNSGETINTLWGKVRKWLSDLKAVAFSGSYNDLSDKPEIPTNSDITAIGNPVQLDGLQGGVPFSEITIEGKNIFDGSLTVGMVATANGTIVASKKYISTTNLISVKPNTGYIAQNSENKTLDVVVYFDKNKSVIGHTYTSAAGFNSFTTPDKCSFIMWRYLFDTDQDDTSALTNIQLEEGNTPTAYEPPITGRELTIHSCGKNLINHNVTSTTSSGVTITSNGDGTITLNGTTTSDLWILLDDKCPIIKGEKYTFSSGHNSNHGITYGVRS